MDAKLSDSKVVGKYWFVPSLLLAGLKTLMQIHTGLLAYTPSTWEASEVTKVSACELLKDMLKLCTNCSNYRSTWSSAGQTYH